MIETHFYGSKEKGYFTAKAFSLFPHIFGDKGQSAILLYSYFRWTDDFIDSPTIEAEKKIDFLNRQRELLLGIKQNNMSQQETKILESGLFQTHTNGLLLKSAMLLFETFENDVLHSELNPRNKDDLITYHQETLLSCIGGLSLLLNEEAINPSDDFLTLLYYWGIIGSLKDLTEDLEAGKIQVNLSKEEISDLKLIPLDERKKYFMRIFTEDRFNAMKKKAISELVKHKKSFFKVNMPFWQQLASYIYMFRAEYQAKKKLVYPF
ncbi:squalene/phytoene synthase family protein [Patescibacteria group bacterium]|nr:squalene/phytoene synthase family protein [Patescibacteria group bacterium]